VRTERSIQQAIEWHVPKERRRLRARDGGVEKRAGVGGELVHVEGTEGVEGTEWRDGTDDEE
jgi:hypothetical protein